MATWNLDEGRETFFRQETFSKGAGGRVGWHASTCSTSVCSLFEQQFSVDAQAWPMDLIQPSHVLEESFQIFNTLSLSRRRRTAGTDGGKKSPTVRQSISQVTRSSGSVSKLKAGKLEHHYPKLDPSKGRLQQTQSMFPFFCFHLNLGRTG